MYSTSKVHKYNLFYKNWCFDDILFVYTTVLLYFKPQFTLLMVYNYLISVEVNASSRKFFCQKICMVGFELC